MIATLLFAKPPKTPQCEHNIVDREAVEWRKRHGVHSDRCQFQSRYKIDGKCYCGRHGPMVAMQILLAEGRLT